MTTPYKSRIVALIGDCQIEIARFKRGLTNYDIRYWTRDLSAKWWIERTTAARETITPRWEPPVMKGAL